MDCHARTAPIRLGMGSWIQNRWLTIVGAVGVRRFAIDGVITIALAAIQYIMSSWMGWAMSAVTIGLVTAVLFVLLISWWLLDYATKLRMEKEPAIDLTGPAVVKTRNGSLIVFDTRNIGGTMLKESFVKLRSIKPDDYGSRSIRRVGLSTDEQRRAKRTGSFNLRPDKGKQNGEEKRLTLVECSVEAGKPVRRLILESGELDLKLHDVNGVFGYAMFAIEAFAESGAKQEVSFRARFIWNPNLQRDEIEIVDVTRG